MKNKNTHRFIEVGFDLLSQGDIILFRDCHWMIKKIGETLLHKHRYFVITRFNYFDDYGIEKKIFEHTHPKIKKLL